MFTSLLAVGAGGALGSLLRWVFNLRFNPVSPHVPLGTLVSNLLAGYLIGVSVAAFARFPDLAPEWRLFVITGILGGLSTFSTFSAEVTAHVQAGRFGWAAVEIGVHVTGSVLMTMLGILSFSLLRR